MGTVEVVLDPHDQPLVSQAGRRAPGPGPPAARGRRARGARHPGVVELMSWPTTRQTSLASVGRAAARWPGSPTGAAGWRALVATLAGPSPTCMRAASCTAGSRPTTSSLDGAGCAEAVRVRRRHGRAGRRRPGRRRARLGKLLRGPGRRRRRARAIPDGWVAAQAVPARLPAAALADAGRPGHPRGPGTSPVGPLLAEAAIWARSRPIRVPVPSATRRPAPNRRRPRSGHAHCPPPAPPRRPAPSRRRPRSGRAHCPSPESTTPRTVAAHGGPPRSRAH